MKVNDRFEIGKRIRARRLERELTQKQLAKRLETTQSHISEIENGVYCCNTDTLLDICDELGLELHIEKKQ